VLWSAINFTIKDKGKIGKSKYRLEGKLFSNCWTTPIGKLARAARDRIFYGKYKRMDSLVISIISLLK